jgi:hypothetical protein
MPGHQCENLLVSLEDNLRQTRRSQRQLIARKENLRLGIIPSTPADQEINQEIEVLEKMAKQTESAIYSVLATLRKNKS